MSAGFSSINTLSDGAATIDLSDDISWPDEFGWSPVARQISYCITGAMLVESAVRQAGRPITLESLSDAAWLPRDTVDQLRSWASDPAAELTLQLRGQTYSVIFSGTDQPVTADPVIYYADPVDRDWYRVTIQLLVK